LNIKRADGKRDMVSPVCFHFIHII